MKFRGIGSRTGIHSRTRSLLGLTTGIAGINQALLLVTAVLIARALAPDSRGALAIYVLLPQFIAQAASLGVPAGVTYAIANGDPARSVVHRTRMLMILQIFVAGAAMALCIPFLVNSSPEEFAPVAYTSVVLVVVSLLQGYLLAVAQASSTSRMFQMLRTVSAVTYATLLVLLYILRDLSLTTIALSWFLAVCVSTMLAWLVIAPQLYDRRESKQTHLSLGATIDFGIRGWIGATSPVDSFRLDQLALATVASPIILGLYVVAGAASSVIRFLSQSAAVLVFPLAVRNHLSRSTSRSLVLQASTVSLTLALLLCVLMPAIFPTLFGEAYVSATHAAQLLMLAAGVAGCRRLISEYARGCGYPLVGSISEVPLIIGVVFILLMGSSISVTGIAGVMLVAGVAALVLCAAALLIARRTGKWAV